MTDDIDPWADDDKPSPHEWEGDLHEDSNGNEYNPWAGSQSPTESRCNALLVNYEERYGEKRYCTKLPESTFIDGGSDFCKTHKSRDALMEQHQELFKHGAFVKNYNVLFDRLEPWEQIESVQTFRDLLDDSVYDFDEELVDWSFDVSETRAPFDEFETQIPVPQTKTYAAKALWTAALDFSKQDRMNSIQFTDGMEKTFVVGVNDAGKPIEAEEEHHLHITSSRLTKDIQKKLELGGVGVDDDANIQIETGDKEYFVATPDELTPQTEESSVSENDFPLEVQEHDDD